MRRKEREITDIKEISEIMKKCDVCRIALNDGDYPYIVPLNFGMEIIEEQITLYFHSALDGHKVDLMRKNKNASFEMDCEHQLEYFKEKGYCTFSYKSIIGHGKITILEENEKLKGLEALMKQYHGPNDRSFNQSGIPRTLVYQLKVEKVVGKRKESIKE